MKSEQINNIIYAELSDSTLNSDDLLTKIIKKIMIHEFYETSYLKIFYMQRKHFNAFLACAKHYSYDFYDIIIVNENDYFIYRKCCVINDEKVI